MLFTTVGVGPGDPELITLKAVKALRSADLVVLPLSADGRESLAGEIAGEHIGGAAVLKLTFPMIRGASARDAALAEQLERSRAAWENARRVVMPVIGDAALYATSAYLYEVWRRLVSPLELELVPGVSAHSAASSRAGRFLALGGEILTLVPGTSEPENIERALRAADSAALFKPSALRDRLRETARSTGPWGDVLRVDRVGLPDEKILRGGDALDPPDEYLSTLLLRR